MCAHLQYARASKAAGRPWTGEAIAELVCGGLGSLQFGLAESAAQQAAPCTTPGSEQLDARLPDAARHYGVHTLDEVTWCLTAHASCALAKHSLFTPLMEVGPHNNPSTYSQIVHATQRLHQWQCLHVSAATARLLLVH